MRELPPFTCPLIHPSLSLLSLPLFQVRHSVQMINQDPPATCGKDVQEAVLEAANSLGLKSKSMVSRAYHDSLFMAM